MSKTRRLSARDLSFKAYQYEDPRPKLHFPPVPETHVFTAVRYVCRRSRQRAGPAFILLCRYIGQFKFTSYDIRYMIKSSIDIINLGNYIAQRRHCQYIVKARHSATIGLEWGAEPNNVLTIQELATVFTPRKFYLGVNTASNVEELVTKTKANWKCVIKLHEM
jgi:hypothetical protein